MCICVCARLTITKFQFLRYTYVFKMFYTSYCTLRQNKILNDCFTDVLQAMFSGSITFLLFAVLQSSKY